MDKIDQNIKIKINTWNNSVLLNIHHDSKLRYILKNHKLIYNFVKEKYANLNTLKTHISALAVIFRELVGVHSKIYQKYSSISTEIK